MGTVGTFLRRGTCSEALFSVLNRAFGHPAIEEERASAPLAGGIVQHGYQCGMVWGTALAAGAQAYRLFGAGALAQTRAIMAAQRVVEAFRAQNHEINCFEITEIDESSTAMQMITQFLIKGGAVGCFRMSARFAPVAFSTINAALSEDHSETPPAPVSCAALVALRMGVSEMHAVMAAGLAGGIGLCGGACGALGAAIWIIGMNSLKERGGKVAFKAPSALDAIDRFVKCTDYEFECSTIVGRKFESVGDHASYVCNGGCSKIIEVLAAQRPS
jgi:hypothetical protein